MDWRGGLDAVDVEYFVKGLTRPDDYLDEFVDTPPEEAGDFNGDRMLDLDDVGLFRDWIEPWLDGAGGAGSFPRQGVPEPGTFSLAATFVVVLAGSRRRLKFGVLHQ
jgi:hypothetical protein